MSKVFFVSDTHFGHGNIIKYCNRPFLGEADKKVFEENGGKWHRGDWKGPGSSNWKMSKEAVNLMDETLLENINNMVGEDDILWHLGDWAFAPKSEYYKTCKYYRNRILCKNVYLIWGNHDRREIANLFSGTYDLYHLKLDNQMVVLCHYALAIWDKSHRGSWHLYGHSHSNFEPWAEFHMPNRKAFDVGVDNAAKLLGEYRPFSLEEINRVMSKRNGFHPDHHGGKNGPSEEELMG